MSNLQDSVLFTPYRLGQVTLRNRTIRSAAFESMGKDFSPTQQLKDYHVSVARGGIGMTTLAYAAVCRSGSRSRANFGCARRSSRRCATSPTPSTRKAPPLRSRSVTAAT